MSTLIIGSKFYGHDSGIFAIVPETKRVFAMQTERATRYKHDKTFPVLPLTRLARELRSESIERIVMCFSFEELREVTFAPDFYEVEMLFRNHFGATYKKECDAAHDAFQRLSPVGKVIHLLTSPFGWQILVRKAFSTSTGTTKRPLEEVVRPYLTKLFPNARIEFRYFEHEYCHAMCTYVTSPYTEALLFTFDGWGDRHFSHAYVAKNGTLQALAKSPHVFVQNIDVGTSDAPRSIYASVGGIYSHFTERLGFIPEADEGKVEALAAYGQPIQELLHSLNECVRVTDLTLVIDVEAAALMLREEAFDILVAQYTREDLAATVQAFLEAVTKMYLPRLIERAGTTHVALAGGVAANVINNLKIFESMTPHIHITPAMADDGSAQGAAYAYCAEAGMDLSWLRSQEMPYFETAYARADVAQILAHTSGIQFEDWVEVWPERIAALVAEGKIGALFHGRAEWGPRALGNRSIIADPRRKDFRDIINKTIKKRPPFQPFCPSILAEEKDRLFEAAYLNKHMTCAFRLKPEYRELLPSGMHIDGTARAQFVEMKDNPNFFRLLKEVKKITGLGVVINTSFNKHGRTIVESPTDALRDFLDTDMDYVLIEGYFVTRL